MITNNTQTLEAPGSPPLYAALLSAQGRILHEMLLHRASSPSPSASLSSSSGRAAVADAGPVLLADVDLSTKDDLLRLLKRYRLRQPIDIADVSDELCVVVSFDEGLGDRLWGRRGGSHDHEFEDDDADVRGWDARVAANAGAEVRAAIRGAEALRAASPRDAERAGLRSSGGADGGALVSPFAASPLGVPLDPRLPSLGHRGVIVRGRPPVSDASNEVVLPVSPAAYVALRHSLGVVEGAAELPPGKMMPLEVGLDGLHGVAYNKGCYIGQELVARTHYKGVVRKRVVPVEVETRTGDFRGCTGGTGSVPPPKTPHLHPGGNINKAPTDAKAQSGAAAGTTDAPANDAPAARPARARALGTLLGTSAAGTRGLAMLRVDAALHAENELEQGRPSGLVALGGERGDEGVGIRLRIPEYWQDDWKVAQE